MKRITDYASEFVDCTAGFDYTTGFDCTARFVDYLTNIQIKIAPFAHIFAKIFEKVFAKVLVAEVFAVEMLAAEVLVVFFT